MFSEWSLDWLLPPSKEDGAPLSEEAPNTTQSGDDEGNRGGKYNERAKISMRTYAWAFCAALNSCCLGYDIGVTTVTSTLIQNYFDLSDFQLEIFVGGLDFMAMIGALCSNLVTDTLGRRKAFMVSSATFIVGIMLESTAQDFETLLAGRAFVGLGVGFGLALDPLYIAEISPPSRRGALVSWSEIADNFGIVLGFTMGLVFYDVNSGVSWRYMLALGGAVPCLVVFFAVFVLAESPRWLMAKGDSVRAKAVLKQIYEKGSEVESVMKDIEDAIDREKRAGSIAWDLIRDPPPSIHRMLVVGIIIAISQQVVGVDTLQYFALYILAEGGVSSTTTQLEILIYLGIIKFSFIIIAAELFDRVGRRSMFFTSLIGMAIALTILGINFWSIDNGIVSMCCMAVYFATFSLGLGPGSWLIPSEIFAMCIRAKAMSLATFFNRLAGALYSSTFLTIADTISWGGYMIMLALICLLLIAYVYFYMPETKGRSLEDMLLYFAEITGDQSILELEATVSGDQGEQKGLKEASRLE